MSAPYTKLEKPLNECALMCRACLAKSGEMKNMFDWGLADDFSKLTKIMLLTSSPISALLCVPCEEVLLTCQRFILQCQSSDLILRNMVQKNGGENKSLEEKTNIPKENTIEIRLQSDSLILEINAPNMAEKIHLPCPYCRQRFLKQSDLLLHLKRQHRVVENFLLMLRFYCSEPGCLYSKESGKNKYFLGRKFLNQHFVKIHASKEYCCKECDLKFVTVSELNRHTKNCNSVFNCGICHLEYKNKERLQVHLMRKHPDLHRKYKQKKQEKLLKRNSVTETEVKRLKKDDISELFCGDSPKKTHANATQTMRTLNTNENIRNDVSLTSWCNSKTESESIKTDEISTQTVFEDILSMKSQNSEDESIFFSETVSLSDIQTQTFPLEFGLSRSNKETITSGTQSPDLSIKETQTCFCLYDSPKLSLKLFDSVSSSPCSMNYISTETQTQDNSSRSTVKTDVMLSFSSAETQTSFEDDL